MIFKNGNVLFEDGFKKIDFEVKDEVFSSFGTFKDDGIDLENKKIIPGLFDIHTHGAVGYDFVTIEHIEDIDKIIKFYNEHGVTSVLATLLTESHEQLIKMCEMTYKASLKNKTIKGIHLEGPFLSKVYKGAQPEEYIVNPSIEKFEQYQKAAHGLIKYITVAPEKEGMEEFIKYLTSHGVVVSMGHSDATFDETTLGYKSGARSITHMFNAMKGIHQHFPSIATAALYYDDLYTEVIMDGIHVNGEMVDFIYKIKGKDRVMGITDSLMATGLPDGEYYLGPNKIIVKDGDCKLKETGVRAGSTLNLFKGYMNFKKFTHSDDLIASKVFSLNQFRLLKMDDKYGSIKEGKIADFLVLNENDELERVYQNGKLIYQR